jgi:hypothetical protein
MTWMNAVLEPMTPKDKKTEEPMYWYENDSAIAGHKEGQ